MYMTDICLLNVNDNIVIYKIQYTVITFKSTQNVTKVISIIFN